MSEELHVSQCPDASNLPPCAGQENCSLSCLTMSVNHLEKCTRCVQHLIGNDENERGCTANHCRRVYFCWQLRGDLIDCLYRCKVKVGTFTFDRIVKQLQMLFELDFENVVYQKKGSQIKRSDVIETAATPTRSSIQSTDVLFCFVEIFRVFKANLETCGMSIDSGDLCGTLQTMVQQMQEHPDDLLRN